jgi:glycosyltransferase involved in cell wall biosynthesis
MARLLYVGSGNPWQGGAGYLVRQNLFLSALGQLAELHLAMFDCKPGPVPAYVKSVTCLTKPARPHVSKIGHLAADVLDPLPRMIRGYDLTVPHLEVQSLHPESFDAIFAFRIDFAHFAGVLNSSRLILDIDDPEHIRNMRRLRMLGAPPDWRTLRDIEKLRAFEVQSVALAKLAFVCQENDRGGWIMPPEVVPNCVDIVENPARNRTKPIVLFVGNCAGGRSSPNVDAVMFFLSDIWPKILQAVPDAEFHLVGKASETVKTAAEKSPRVHLRGFVDHLAKTYAETAVSIAPIRFGTGTRIKILEAFAHACPVVSTLAGAEGIEAIPGREIELAVDADDFAASTIAMLKNPPGAELIGRGGYLLATRAYNARAQQQKLIARFKDFLTGEAMGGEAVA